MSQVRVQIQYKFYWESPENNHNYDIKRDIYFVGKDKGRLNKIINLEKICDELNISYLFQIAPTHVYSLPNRRYSKYVSYNDVQKSIKSSKSILDLTVSVDAGPSLRSLEATFYKKKLITDNSNVKNFRFYDRNNVFIINVDHIGRLKEFIESPYHDVDDDTVNYYEIENWIKRFH